MGNELWTDSETIWRIFRSKEEADKFIVQGSTAKVAPLAIRWSPPHTGAVKVNVDGSATGNPGPADYGGLLQDSDGNWILGFKGSVGITQILFAELRGILQGLKIAWENGFRQVFCDCDCMKAIRLITLGVEEFHIYGAIIAEIRQMLHWNWNVQIAHVYREVNACAYQLAKDGVSSSYDLVVLQDPPTSLLPFIFADAVGTLFYRV